MPESNLAEAACSPPVPEGGWTGSLAAAGYSQGLTLAMKAAGLGDRMAFQSTWQPCNSQEILTGDDLATSSGNPAKGVPSVLKAP